MRSSAITCTWPALPRATCLTIWPVNIGHRLQKVGSTRRRGRPCPIWGVCHSTDLRQLRNHDLEKDRIAAAVRSLDGVMALHEAQKAEIAELFDLPADRIRVVGTGYNSQEFAPRAGLRAAHPLRVLYVGKILAAPRAWKASFAPWTCCRSIRWPWSLCLVGGYSDQVQYDRIVKLASCCRFPVVFGGRVSQDDLVLSYSRSHVFALPSFFEGLPLVTVEALASGCRAVVTSLPGVRPWLDASLPDAPVSFVEPPRIQGVDVPVPEDLPAFEQRLSDALLEQLQAAAERPLEGTGFDATAVSWDSLAARMVAVRRLALTRIASAGGGVRNLNRGQGCVRAALPKAR